MFGIFYGIYNGIMAGINGIDKGFQNSKERAKAIDIGDVTYYSRGELYLTENGRRVLKSCDVVTGHDVIKDLRTGKVYYDLTKIQEEKEIKKRLLEGKTVYQINKRDELMARGWENRTGIYCCMRDIETKHLVDEIWINKYNFYLDIFTGKILRLTDGCISSLDDYKKRGILRNEPLNPEDIIYYFNKRQERLKENSNYNRNGNEWMKDTYYLRWQVKCHEQLFMNANGDLAISKLKLDNGMYI